MMTHPDRSYRSVGRMALGLFSLALAFSACDAPKSAPGGANAGASGPPKIEVVGGDKVEWGEVGPGVLKHALKITNVGGDTLRIADVKASCGCTTAPLDKKILLPGDTATVDVSMDVANRSGEQHKTITITSNDSTKSAIVVGLHAMVMRDVVATPEFFQPITSGKKGREDTTSVELRNTSDAAVTVQPPVIPNAAEMLVRFDMTEPITLQPAEARRVVAHVKPIKDGTATAEVVFKMVGKKQSEIKLNLTASVNPEG